MFVGFVDVEIVLHTILSGKMIYMNKINKSLTLDNHFGIEYFLG